MPKIKKWEISDNYIKHKAEISGIMRESGLLYPTAALLYNRGCDTPGKARQFIGHELETLYNPFLLKDMETACLTIEKHLDANSRIVVYGDYDVDGVTSVSALYLYLKSKGADIEYYIPNRTGEGYGINIDALDKLAEKGTGLIITVDTGVTAVEEVEYAKEKGMAVVVTDHHECYGDLPGAEAVINPRRPDCEYPFKELAGVGVTFKLICALESRFRDRNGIEGNYLKDICRDYIDLIALGTVADVMPLVDENRLIVSMGLKKMDKDCRFGIQALIEEASSGDKNTSGHRNRSETKKKMTSSSIGYVLAPRINAAGRIRSASEAVELFLAESYDEARIIAANLCKINRQRQEEENRTTEEALAKIREEHDFENDYVIILDGDNWHHGVIGIAASRITECFNLPSILITFDGDVGKGSGRSICGMNLVDALKSCGDLLTKYGGHELAAGLSINREDLPEFKRRMNEYARTCLTKEDLVTSYDVDMILEETDITLRQAEELDFLEPCGVSNPVPLFVMCSLTAVSVSAIGNGKHTRFIFEKNGVTMQAVYFGSAPDAVGISAGDGVDVLFNLNVNDFHGNRTPQLLLRDIRYSAEQEKLLTSEKELYRGFYEGSREVPSEHVPNRDDMARLYVCMKRELPKCDGVTNLNTLREIVNSSRPEGVPEYSRVKLMLMLDVLRETELITLCDLKDASGSDCTGMKIELVHVEEKVNLEKSGVYKRLRSNNS